MNLEIEKPDLAQYQKDILYCDARFTITEASTKVGKTFSHIWWIFERAHADWNKTGFYHWWVAPSVVQALIAYNRLKIILIQTGLYKFNDTKRTIHTPRGSIIEFKTASDPDSLYGEDVYSCVFDEAPRAKYTAFVALRSTLTATKAPMKLIGNFGGVSNWMHLLKEKALTDKNYAYFKITAWDAVRAGILSEEEILQAQKDLSPKDFASLYLAEEQESEDMLVSYDAIKDLWTNEHSEKGVKYITADIALHGSDRFVLMVWDGWTVIDFLIIEKCEADEVTEIIKTLASKHQVGRRNIAYDADGLGAFLRGYLKGAFPFNNGAKAITTKKKNLNYKNLKSQCGYELAKAINNNEIFINCELPKEDVIKELECLRSWETDNDGKIQLMPKKKIKEILGVSPDLLDCFMMRMIFKLKPKSRAPRSKIL